MIVLFLAFISSVNSLGIQSPLFCDNAFSNISQNEKFGADYCVALIQTVSVSSNFGGSMQCTEYNVQVLWNIQSVLLHHYTEVPGTVWQVWVHTKDLFLVTGLELISKYTALKKLQLNLTIRLFLGRCFSRHNKYMYIKNLFCGDQLRLFCYWHLILWLLQRLMK